MWTLAYGHQEDRTPTHGYEPTREAAMAAFAKSWPPGNSPRPPLAKPLAAFGGATPINANEKLAPELAPNRSARANIKQHERPQHCSKHQQRWTFQYKATQNKMAQSPFQDRCLKPLGHPSLPMFSTT